MKHAGILLMGAAFLASTALVIAAPTKGQLAAVADTARPAADTARDENRKPADMLAFGGIGPGKVVVDLLPGGGYFTGIFAKAGGAGGRGDAEVGAPVGMTRG